MMSNKEKTGWAPALRFPEFRDEWEEKKVSDLFRITRGKVLAVNKMTTEPSLKSIYPVYSSQTKENGLTGYYTEYLYENAITWTTDGYAGVVKYRHGKFYCTNVCGVLISDIGFANSCIAEMLNRVTKKYVSYVGNPKLMNNVMAKIIIKYPSVKEQQKIADFLSSVDELINAQTEKLETLKAHKKGLLQQLFPAEGETTPALRFPEFRDEGGWGSLKLGDIADFIKGKGIAKADIEEGGKNKCIRYGELYTEYKEVITKIVSRTNVELNVLSEKNDILMPTSDVTPNGLATASALDEPGVILGGDILIIRSNKIYNKFFCYFVAENKTSIMRLISGVTVYHIYGPDLATLKILLPPIEEQQKIADFLSSVDELINAQTEKLETLKVYKKGLLQQLFPAMEITS